MDWAIGVAEYPDKEYQVIRYESHGRAMMNLAGLMAACGPYNEEDMIKCMCFLMVMEDDDPEEYDKPGKYITSLELTNYLFVLGKFENFKPTDEGMTFKVVQDHRFCTPDHCFGDIAEMN